MESFAPILTATFIRHLDFHPELPSTNSRGMEIAAQLPTMPALILTDCQTAGRGRGSNRWWGGEGGLTFSVVLEAASFGIAGERWPLVSLAAGLAVAQALDGFVKGFDVRLKWPNDVFLNGRKVCGILVETAAARPGALIVGIGINVNNSFQEAPPEIHHTGISLSDSLGQPLDRSEVLVAVLKRLENCLSAVADDFTELAEQWRERCFLQGRTVQIRASMNAASGECVTGVCQSIDDSGALLLQTETGLTRCHSGMVTRIL